MSVVDMADDAAPVGASTRWPTPVPRIGRRLDVRGTVQGVGFRPFVYRLATELGVDGSVHNAGGHVVIDVAGAERSLDELARRLRTEAPPLSRVREIQVGKLAALPAEGVGFHIEISRQAAAVSNDVPPDIATCDDCLAELTDPTDRRYRYPFINCTNCGPRATIIDALPYDRAATAMRDFVLCADCRREYENPADRRFHAEPIVCPACGPILTWRSDGLGRRSSGDAALIMAERALEHGAVIALKGLGGYQLVCDATRPGVVRRLRVLKHRPSKPFAVMVADLDAAIDIAEPTDVERDLLLAPTRPIVLVTARPGSKLATAVHEGTPKVGLFLPNTPLHYLLMTDLRRPMIVTSGNHVDEPMAIDDADALAALEGVADGFLAHDRPIRTRYDDSVVQVIDERPRVIRRARGYAPQVRELPAPAGKPLLAVGAELKHTFTVAQGARAVLSPHIGDLENAASYDAFTSTVERLSRLVAITPELVAHDMHPAYFSTQYARSWDPARRIAVQHHHAHVVSCAAEYGIKTPFIGVAYDGLGMGDDGTLWGGEILVADLRRYRRFARFSYAPLPGGPVAVRRPLRMALGYLLGAESFGEDDEWQPANAIAAVLSRVEEREVLTVRRMVDAHLNSPLASSAGRLFDAVASLLGLRDAATFEGEAAIALENAVAAGCFGELPWTLRRAEDVWVYDVRPTLRATLDAVRDGVPVGVTAARFHQTITAVTVELCRLVREETAIRDVCLGGGVFQNRRLGRDVLQALRGQGFDAFLGEQVPANDAGISFGQAAIAAAVTGRR